MLTSSFGKSMAELLNLVCFKLADIILRKTNVSYSITISSLYMSFRAWLEFQKGFWGGSRADKERAKYPSHPPTYTQAPLSSKRSNLLSILTTISSI